MTVPSPRSSATGELVWRRSTTLVALVALAAAALVSFVPADAATAADPTESPTPGLTMAEARVGHTATPSTVDPDGSGAGERELDRLTDSLEFLPR
jgi:hypothetical protein